MAKVAVAKVGDRVIFTGYTQLDPGQEEILTPGSEYTVQKIEGDGYVVVDRDGRGDTVFEDEIAPVEKKATRKASTKSAPAKAKATETTGAKKAKKTPVKAPAKAPAKKGGNKKPKASTEGEGDGGTEVITPIAPVSPIHELTDSASVATILESKDMLSAAKELAVAAEETFISLGGVLSHIYDTGAHKTLGYDGKRGFADYMLNELNILYRKGMYLIEIYKVARTYNLDERLLAEIGWSKMKEIANKIDADNATELLEYARSHTREDLVAHVRKTYVKAGEATDDPGKVMKTRLTFNLYGDQAQVVERALAAASAQITDATPEQALMLITSEWSQFTEQVELSSQQMLEAVVDRFGLQAVQDAVAAIAEKKTEKVVELVEA